MEFYGLKSKKEEAQIKSYVERLDKFHLPIIVDKKHFSKLLNIREMELGYILKQLEHKYYHTFKIKKKSGGERIINAPSKKLYTIQKWVLNNILDNITFSEYAMGFVKKKSIVDNAKVHLNKNCVLNVDIKNFFTSIKRNKVFGLFYYYGYTNYVSYILSRLCTYNDYLPQGAPTSPIISNIICFKLDKRLSGLARKFNASYTRYADDITFSSNYSIFGMLKMINKILGEEGFRINESKTRILYKHQRQEVTGLVVNKKVHVNKKYINSLKQEIYYCKKYGVHSHRERVKDESSFYKEHIYGKVEFVKMVDKELGEKLFKELDSINWESEYGT